MEPKARLISILVFFPVSLFARESWFISPEEAILFLNQKDTIWVDAREKRDYKKGHVVGALNLTWEELSLPHHPQKGNLLPIPELERILGGLGMDSNTTVIVYGNSEAGWGEEARIAWTLRSLGHKKTFIVDGGYQLLLEKGVATSREIPRPKKQTQFRVQEKQKYTATKEDVLQGLHNPGIVFLDTREQREFIGGTPYGEARGGHLPKAKHIHFKEFFFHSGKLKSPQEIVQLLEANGIHKKQKIIAYCTGGVRSAMVTAILVSLGYDAYNYPGSMWEWSHLPKETYPLVRGYE